MREYFGLILVLVLLVVFATLTVYVIENKKFGRKPDCVCIKKKDANGK